MGYKSPHKLTINGGHTTYDMGDSSTYYFLNSSGLAPAAATSHALVMPCNGIVRAVTLKINIGTAGTAEDTTYSVRNITTATDALIGVVSLVNPSLVSNLNMALAVSAGDEIIIKVATPAWVTNPLQVRVMALVIIECE